MTVQQVYQSVCSALLERGGLQLGLLTLPQFLSFYSDTLQDFLGRSGLAKGVSVIPQLFGTQQYTLPDCFGEPDMVLSQGKALQRSSEMDIANFDRNWQSAIKSPRLWWQDKMNMKNIGLFPAPLVNGNQPVILPLVIPGNSTGDGFYGTFSVVTAGTDVTITAAAPFYGIVSQESGSSTLIPAGPCFGTVGDLETIGSNVAAIGSVAEFNESPVLDYPVEWLPGSFALYIGYGVLAKVFGMDGELKDKGRQDFCLSRYEEGIMLGRAIMEESMMEEAA